jgi:hypothetical protein
VTKDAALIIINLIGEKRHHKLFIEGEEFEL